MFWVMSRLIELLKPKDYSAIELSRRSAVISQFSRDPRLAIAHLSDPDGFLREAALDALVEPLNNPDDILAVITRLNDWVPQVRAAAVEALGRVVTVADPSVWVPVIRRVLPQARNWQRWSTSGPARDVFYAVFMRDDVLDRLVNELLSNKQANMGEVYKWLSCNPTLDAHLQDIAAKAPLPHIRGMALNCLLTKTLRWPDHGSRIVWTDKPQGKYRRERTYHHRAITITVPLANVLKQAAQDKSRRVRLQAMDGLIAATDTPELMPHISSISAILKRDLSPTMQHRRKILLQKLAERGVQID